jgi:hypothetical protein
LDHFLEGVLGARLRRFQQTNRRIQPRPLRVDVPLRDNDAGVPGELLYCEGIRATLPQPSTECMPGGMQDASIRQIQLTADIEKRMRHPSRRNAVPPSDAGLEGKYVIRRYARHSLPLFYLGQNPLGPARKRYPTAAILGLTLDDFDAMKREVNGGPCEVASLTPAQPGIAKERHSSAHSRTELMEPLNVRIGNDVFALALSGQEFDFWRSGNDFPLLGKVEDTAKGAKVMINCGHGQGASSAFLLPAPLHEVLNQCGVDTVKPGFSEGRKAKQRFQMLYVKLLGIFRNAGWQVFKKAVLELGQRRRETETRYQLIALPGFNPPGFSFVGFLCAKLVRNALNFYATPPHFSAPV